MVLVLFACLHCIDSFTKFTGLSVLFQVDRVQIRHKLMFFFFAAYWDSGHERLHSIGRRKGGHHLCQIFAQGSKDGIRGWTMESKFVWCSTGKQQKQLVDGAFPCPCSF